MESDEQKPPWRHVDFCPSKQFKTPILFLFRPWENTIEDVELDSMKKNIEKYEEAHIWELAKKMANPYECIYTQDDSHFHPSLCIYRPLSRSFYKMIEMLHISRFFQDLPKTTQKIRSAHVAEGPGGFIQAFLELAEKNKKTVSSATAITLKPRDSHTPGWRRASSFLQKHPEVILHYGVDESGDIYQKGNQESFVKAVKPGVHLFTADGGFDFSKDYSLQEKKIFHLLICSIQIGIRSLLPEGMLILKIFDIYSHSTQLLLLLTSCFFKEWTLYKPVTSRPCNSERYFICKGYRSQIPSELYELFDGIEKNSLHGLYPFQEGFLHQVERQKFKKSIDQITRLQKESLIRAETYIQNPSLWQNDFQHYFEKSLLWCNSFQMPTIQKKPIDSAVIAVVSQMCVKASHLQLQKPGAEKENPPPSDLALPA